MSADDWSQTTWGDMVELRYGKALRGYRDGSGSIPVYGTNGPVGFTDSAQSKGPGVIVGRKGAYRGVHFSPTDFWVIDTAFYIAPKHPIDMRWAYYALQLADINGLDSGSAIPSTTRESFSGLRATRPPLPEQQAIAEVLGALDDKIAANSALAATAREYALALLTIDAPTTSLGNVVIHHKQQVNPASIDAPLVEHFSLPAFDAGAGPEVTAPEAIQSNKFKVHTPSLLVSKLNPRTPRNWPVNDVGERPRLASTEFLVLEPFVCDPWVMWALVSQPNFSRELEGKVAGTSGSHQRVRPEGVLATPILDPRSLHSQLMADVSEVLAPIDAFGTENRTLAATRDALLPQLMSGKLRVRDAERIASEAGV